MINYSFSDARTYYSFTFKRAMVEKMKTETHKSMAQIARENNTNHVCLGRWFNKEVGMSRNEWLAANYKEKSDQSDTQAKPESKDSKADVVATLVAQGISFEYDANTGNITIK